ncbi:hypothetical protein T02_8043 [Trichinella nativa]|uniref:Uncharacterized protein n=1 Tax=Trichinella nativa TaxID=6335 RepID=A0A0V1KQU3_9BILA|nr:hypothetical protein T02_8043 [Trichinella nativa]
MGHFKVIKINIALLFAIILLQFISNASSASNPFHKPKKIPIAVKEHLKKLMESNVIPQSVRDQEDDTVAETKQVLRESHDSFHHLEVTIQKLEEKLEIEKMLYDPWDKKDTSIKRVALEFLIRVAKQLQEELLTESGMMAGIQRQRKKCYVKYYMLDEYCATRKDDNKLLLKIERKFYKCQSHCESTTKVENFYTTDLCVLKCFEKKLDKFAEKLGVPFDEVEVNAAVNKLETLDQSALPFTSI